MRAFVATLLLALALPAHATWKPEYASAAPDVRDWYERAELTPAAQLRFGFKSCCAHSDTVKTRFRPTKDGGDGWEYLDGETWRRVPPDIVHTDQHAPGGEPVMFAIGGKPTCFFPPMGGL